MITQFQTIAGRSQGLYKEKGSKFIAIATPVVNKEEVKYVLENIRQEYFDARHHCYAYILGHNQSDFRANDDGEPNHSAGDPILGQIRANGLTNIVIVVVRYFGGTKLGVSGLINAYRTSAEEAIKSADVLLLRVTKRIVLNYDYSVTNEAMRLVNDFDLKITSQQFESQCMLTADVVVDRLEALTQKVKLLNDTGVYIQMIID